MDVIWLLIIISTLVLMNLLLWSQEIVGSPDMLKR